MKTFQETKITDKFPINGDLCYPLYDRENNEVAYVFTTSSDNILEWVSEENRR